MFWGFQVCLFETCHSVLKSTKIVSFLKTFFFLLIFYQIFEFSLIQNCQSDKKVKKDKKI